MTPGQLSGWLQAPPCSLLCNAAEGLDHWGCSPPLNRFTVFPSLHEVLLATEIGMLIENPGSIQDFAGVDFPEMKLLHDRGAVLCGFMHLATKVTLLKELDLVFASTGLNRKKEHQKLLSHRTEAVHRLLGLTLR